MPLLPEQKLIALALGYNPLTDDEAAEPADLSCCKLDQSIHEGWPVVYWHGDWHYAPSMGDVEEMVFDSWCETPSGSEVEPDDPASWLSILGMV